METKQEDKKEKQNKTKQKRNCRKKWFSVENLTGYDDIVCDFPLGTFNLLDRVTSFSCLFIWI